MKKELPEPVKEEKPVVDHDALKRELEAARIQAEKDRLAEIAAAAAAKKRAEDAEKAAKEAAELKIVMAMVKKMDDEAAALAMQAKKDAIEEARIK